MQATRWVRTDARGRLTLPGRVRQAFAVEELSDGSVLLHPVRTDPALQHAYDTDPELRALLSAAATSPTRPARRRQRRTT